VALRNRNLNNNKKANVSPSSTVRATRLFLPLNHASLAAETPPPVHLTTSTTPYEARRYYSNALAAAAHSRASTCRSTAATAAASTSPPPTQRTVKAFVCKTSQFPQNFQCESS